MKKKKKQENKIKKKAKNALRKKKRREVVRQMQSYLKVRRSRTSQQSVSDASLVDERSPSDAEVRLDDDIAFARCDGAGACCFDQPIALEPGDVLRLMRHHTACASLHVTSTSDLFTTREDGKPLMVHFFDEPSGVPVCFALPRLYIAGKSNRSVCPFHLDASSSCILGDDRPTQCRAHPVARLARINGQRQIEGWTYRIHDVPCMGCSKDCAKDRRILRVDAWLQECGMTGDGGRYHETDMYLAFCDWLKRARFPKQMNQLASAILFDWGRLSPETPDDVFSLIAFARLSLERIEKEGLASLVGGGVE